MGNKRYDKHLSSAVKFRYFTKLLAGPVFFASSFPVFNFIQDSIPTIMDCSILTQVILETYGVETMSGIFTGFSGLTALYVFYRSMVKIENRYVAGIYVTVDGDISIKFFDLYWDWTKIIPRLSTKPNFATILDDNRNSSKTVVFSFDSILFYYLSFKNEYVILW